LLRELGGLEHAIASVRVPVLVLADPNDKVVPFETARRLTRALPDARLQLVEGAGHHLPRRAPAAVADAIVAFLAQDQITDHSVGRDVNSSSVLSVLVRRGQPAAGPGDVTGRRRDQVANTRHDRSGSRSARPGLGPQGNLGARERIAGEQAARKRAEARRRLLAAIAVVGAVLAVVVTLVTVKLATTAPRPVASESPATPVAVRQVTTVPAAVLTSLGHSPVIGQL
jgi:TAP-like protein